MEGGGREERVCLENYTKFRFLGPLFTDESPSSLSPSMWNVQTH